VAYLTTSSVGTGFADIPGVRPVAHQNVISTAIRALAAERHPACLLDTQAAFIFVNEAWDRRAIEGGQDPSALGGELIGTSWVVHVAGEQARRRRAELFERALRGRGARRAVVQVGEWNTPTTAALLSTRLEPVLVNGGDAIAISVVHTIVRERPIAEVYEVVDRPAGSYRVEGGAIVQCSCCGRVQDPEQPDRWDLVPALLLAPGPATHVICDLCAALHYGPDHHS
jgi:hypothetical protein